MTYKGILDIGITNLESKLSLESIEQLLLTVSSFVDVLDCLKKNCMSWQKLILIDFSLCKRNQKNLFGFASLGYSGY